LTSTWGLLAQVLCYTDTTTRIFSIHVELSEIQLERGKIVLQWLYNWGFGKSFVSCEENYVKL
jgi:hypothetical protein